MIDIILKLFKYINNNTIIMLRQLLCSHYIYEYKTIQVYDKGGKLVIEYNVIDSWNKKGYRPAYYTKKRYKKCIYCGRVEKNLTLDILSKDKWVLSSQQEYDLHDSRELIDLAIIDRDKKLRDLLGDDINIR